MKPQYLGVTLQNIVKYSLTKILMIQLTTFKKFCLVQNIFKDLIPEVNEINKYMIQATASKTNANEFWKLIFNGRQKINTLVDAQPMESSQ